MKLKIDENLPEEMSLAFRNAGWDRRTVVEEHLSGGDDGRISEVRRDEQRILVAFDRGFSNLKTYAHLHSIGVVVLRLRSQDKRYVLAVAARLINALLQRELRSELWIVNENRIRIRAVPPGGTLLDRPANSA